MASRERSLEQIVVVLVGVFEISGGLILSLVAANGSFFGAQIPQNVLGLLSDVGIGLIAAGILTLSVDLLGRRRHKEDLAKIRDAHFEAVLKGFIPSPFFEEIRSQIIMQPFISSNYHGTFDLEFRDETKMTLIKTETSTWEVTNVGSTTQDYELRISEGWETFDPNPEEVAIEYVRVERQRNEIEEWGRTDIDKRAKRAANYIRIALPIRMVPNERLRVLVKTTNILTVPGEYNLHLTRPTVNLRVNVSFPNALAMTVVPIHPSRELLRKEVDLSESQQWSFSAAFLPYQGVRLFWERRADERRASTEARPTVQADVLASGESAA